MNCRKDSLTPFSLNYTPNLLKTQQKKQSNGVFSFNGGWIFMIFVSIDLEKLGKKRCFDFSREWPLR